MYVDLALRYAYYILLKVIRFKQKIISAGLWHMKSSKCVIVEHIDLCMCVWNFTEYKVKSHVKKTSLR